MAVLSTLNHSNIGGSHPHKILSLTYLPLRNIWPCLLGSSPTCSCSLDCFPPLSLSFSIVHFPAPCTEQERKKNKRVCRAFYLFCEKFYCSIISNAIIMQIAIIPYFTWKQLLTPFNSHFLNCSVAIVFLALEIHCPLILITCLRVIFCVVHSVWSLIHSWEKRVKTSLI